MGAIAFSPRAARTASVSNWLSPVQAVFAFFAPPTSSTHAHANPDRQLAATGQLQPKTPSQARSSIRSQASSIASPVSLFAERAAPPVTLLSSDNNRSCLKILREFEPGKSRLSTGRLVISGRMVDVCAALDRMAT